MNAKEALDDLGRALAEVKEQGQEVVSVAALENYLANLKQHVEKVGELDRIKLDSDLAAFRAEHESNLAHYDAQQKHSIEMIRSVFAYGQAALKSSILINGGAAAALLAFIGKIWSEETGQAAVTALTNAMVLFSFGVLAGAIGIAATYFSQLSYTSSWKKTGIGFHVFTVLIVAAAYVLFGVGSYAAYAAFLKHLSLSP